MNIKCKSQTETEELGRLLARCAAAGDVYCLSGDLGAGKTCLAKAIAEGLGVAPDKVTSPTFSIMNVYQGAMEIRHFDLYRLRSPEELEDIGFEEYVGADGLTLLEWGELFADYLPNEYLHIEIEKIPEGRVITLTPCGKHYEELVKKVQELVNAGN